MSKSFLFLALVIAVAAVLFTHEHFSGLSIGLSCIVLILSWLSGYYAAEDDTKRQAHIEELQTRIRH